MNASLVIFLVGIVFFKSCSYTTFIFQLHSSTEPSDSVCWMKLLFLHQCSCIILKRSLFFLYIAMVDGLTSKTISWEKEKGIEFTYDGVSTFFKKLVS